MIRAPLLAGLLAVSLVACGPVADPLPPLGADGQPVQRVYRIGPGDADRVQSRALDAVNTLRAQSRLAPLRMEGSLTSAAAAHSRDMSAQGRAWAFGSDGSPPVVRVARAGYRGTFLGKAVSETYESELETVNGWMGQADTRGVLMDPAAREMGFAWHQDPDGKLWWTLITGTPGGADPLAAVAAGPAPMEDPGPFFPGVFEPM